MAVAQWVWRPLRSWVSRYAPLRLAAAVLAFCVWDLITLKFNWMTLPYFPWPECGVRSRLVEDRALLFESTWHSLLLLVTGYAGRREPAGLVIWRTHRLVRLPCAYWGMPVLKILGPLRGHRPHTFALVMTLSSQSFVSAVAAIRFRRLVPRDDADRTAGVFQRPHFLSRRGPYSWGGARAILIFRVALPAAMPNIFLGLFHGVGAASFLTLIVAETVGVQAGLGWYLTWQEGYVEYGKVYAALLIMAVFFSTLMSLLFRVRTNHVLRWQKGVIKW